MAPVGSTGSVLGRRVGRASRLACRSSAKAKEEEGMTALAEQRRFFAEEIEALCGLRSTALVEAFATTPRETFLPPGPWIIRSETDYLAGMPRRTPDADPRRVYHNVAIAIDV